MTRAVLWTTRAQVRTRVDTLLQRHDEVVVALEGAPDPSLPSRWASVRAQLPARAWCTPLPHTHGLPTRLDRTLALPVRLGAFDHLEEESGEDEVPALPHAERALVVLRAQPFHRGHLALVQHALTLAEEVVVVIAAAERSHAARDPFTAGERLALVRAGLTDLLARCWLVALPAPAWPALALPELRYIAPPYQLVVTHNPLLAAMAVQHGKRVARLPEPVRVANDVLSATAIRARLAREGAGSWLDAHVPEACAALLAGSALSERCAVIAAAGG
ncbi:MAG: adenylyltransferase/cytidyltransferase family protein [Polyangiales bacterium]